MDGDTKTDTGEDKTPASPPHGVPHGVAKEESHGGYGGTDRLQTEAGPLHPEAGPEQGKDI